MRYFLSSQIIAFSFTLISCVNMLKDDKPGEPVELEPVSVNDQYSLAVPKYMTKTTALNEEASLQFQNIFKTTYVIVIDENKQEFIEAYKNVDAYDSSRSAVDNYCDTQVQLTSSGMEVISKTEIKSFDINGLAATSVEIDANVEGVPAPITYFLTFIEGKETLYMIMAWTFRVKKGTYRGSFEKMARSFKEL
ncbi:MAG TPA: hypothetical protein VEB86_05655 [Chryseosolibacter sp.]|nr:hypothetical protein [Chryseosolibacter sp.]